MRIRSVTCFINVTNSAADAETIHQAGALARETGERLQANGFEVQTRRLATQPLSLLPGDPLSLAGELQRQGAQEGFEYISLGPVLATSADADLSRLELIPEIIRTTEVVFAGVLVALHEHGLHLGAMRRLAHIVPDIAHTTELGFGNLRLAMLANVGPHSPFFPAAYHDGGPPALAIATESADMALDAVENSRTLTGARDRLVGAVEAAAQRISGTVRPLAERFGNRFAGIDFSLAPFPEEARSIGAAVERLGVQAFGAPGTLFAAAFLTDCLRRAAFPHCGFNGLMLPVLEDATLAARSCDGVFTVNDLLLYSAVCGTGLDTVPLPGDVREEELASIFLDVAALALRLNKPLTARLMPVPGARPGTITSYDFAYFANGRVLDVKGLSSKELFARDEWLAL